jgi:hypothetical protein
LSPVTKRCYVVCNRSGRILALLPLENLRLRDDAELGWRPLAGPRQIVVEVELTAEHADFALHELIEAFNVDLDRKTGKAHLRHRTNKAAKKARGAK